MRGTTCRSVAALGIVFGLILLCVHVAGPAATAPGAERVAAQREGLPLAAGERKRETRPLAAAKAVAQDPIVPVVDVEHPLSSDVGRHPAIEAALDATTDFVIEPQPLKDALDFISQRYRIPLLLDNKALEDASIDTATEIKLSVPGLKLRQSLNLLLEQLPQPLGFDIRDGVMWITTVENINQHRFVVVYDCRDLIHLRSTYPHSAAHTRTTPSQERTGASDRIFSEAAPTLQPGNQTAAAGPNKRNKKRDERGIDTWPAKSSSESEVPLITVIRYAGDADDWSDEEGGGKITELGGLLVINQNRMVHEQIKRILADLRRMKKEGAFATFDNDHGLAPSPSAPQAAKPAGP